MYVEICALEPDTGMALAFMERFYYDKVAGTCKGFVYGGVGGNQNNFFTEKECMEKCKGQ